MPVLADLLSFGNVVRRKLGDLLSDPVGVAQMNIDRVLPTGYEQREMFNSQRGNAANPAAVDSAKQKIDDFSENAAQLGAMMKLVYHGTAGPEFPHFSASHRGSMTDAPDARAATFVADSRAGAEPYSEWAAAKFEQDPRILSAYLSAKNPLILGTEFTKDNSVGGALLQKLIEDKNAAFEYAKKHGHDVVYYPQGNANDLPGTFAVFDTNALRIKNQNIFK